MRAFCSFSGGKDSVLSLFKAQRQGVKCEVLLNMVDEERKRTRSHGLPVSLLQMQAEAIGIKILQRPASWDGYEGVFKEAILSLKQEGIEAGIFGDIDLEDHREWIERVCKEVGVLPLLPLWGRQREEIVSEFVELGFKAFVCAVRLEVLRPYLGQDVDKRFLSHMRLASIDPSGEAGEFHTFVYDGPIFKRALRVRKGKEVAIDGHYFLQLEPLEDGCPP